uniref:Uncharacterized protein n=1 Tax=Oryza brachyantha TaxID=4533 RepID=J3LIV3_ORYBR
GLGAGGGGGGAVRAALAGAAGGAARHAPPRRLRQLPHQRQGHLRPHPHLLRPLRHHHPRPPPPHLHRLAGWLPLVN